MAPTIVLSTKLDLSAVARRTASLTLCMLTIHQKVFIAPPPRVAARVSARRVVLGRTASFPPPPFKSIFVWCIWFVGPQFVLIWPPRALLLTPVLWTVELTGPDPIAQSCQLRWSWWRMAAIDSSLRLSLHNLPALLPLSCPGSSLAIDKHAPPLAQQVQLLSLAHSCSWGGGCCDERAPAWTAATHW